LFGSGGQVAWQGSRLEPESEVGLRCWTSATQRARWEVRQRAVDAGPDREDRPEVMSSAACRERGYRLW